MLILAQHAEAYLDMDAFNCQLYFHHKNIRLSCVIHGPIYGRFMGCNANG